MGIVWLRGGGWIPLETGYSSMIRNRISYLLAMTTIGRNSLLTGSSLGVFVESVGQQGGQEFLRPKIDFKAGLSAVLHLLAFL